MFRPRVIPVLLLKDNILVKSTKFKKYRYIGDPINAVKVFNDLKADELTFLDISATIEKRIIPLELVEKVGEEANMPFSVGGGITKLKEIQNIIAKGAEKVILNTSAISNPDFIKESSDNFGTSTITVCIDVKRRLFGKEVVWTHGGKKATNLSPIDCAMMLEDKGAGEIIIQSIDRDGQMNGYDVELIRNVSTSVSIPVVALGGAGKIEDLIEGYKKAHASAVAAGSMFVYQGSKKGVLVNYLEKDSLSLFK
jgi:imidazole glycerol-phosphate synthase subunit HisF